MELKELNKLNITIGTEIRTLGEFDEIILGGRDGEVIGFHNGGGYHIKMKIKGNELKYDAHEFEVLDNEHNRELSKKVYQTLNEESDKWLKNNDRINSVREQLEKDIKNLLNANGFGEYHKEHYIDIRPFSTCIRESFMVMVKGVHRYNDGIHLITNEDGIDYRYSEDFSIDTLHRVHFSLSRRFYDMDYYSK